MTTWNDGRPPAVTVSLAPHRFDWHLDFVVSRRGLVSMGCGRLFDLELWVRYCLNADRPAAPETSP